MDSVAKLSARDRHRLQATVGWLELGAPGWADEEFVALPIAFQQGPDGLEIRWRILAQSAAWSDANIVAKALIQISPEEPSGWIHLSYGLHELRQTESARANLMKAVMRFPDNGVIAYNLACYANQLGRSVEAARWLARAMRLDGRADTLDRAKNDPDLQSLIERFQSQSRDSESA